MDTLKMFALEEYDQEAPPQEGDETENGAKDVLERDRIDDHAGTGEEHEPGRDDIAAPKGNGELVSAEETSSIYEATGLIGPFKLNPLALVFPDTSDQDLLALAANISAIGILEEPTVAWTQGTEHPPEVIDGKRIIQAAEISGVQPTYRLLRQDIAPKDYVWAKNG